MKPRLLWTPQAREDLIEIYVVIGSNDPKAADRFVNRIENLSAHLTDHPRLGARRRDIHPTARMLVEKAYLILYETDPDTDDGPIETVEIVRVLDGRRDLKTGILPE